MINETIRELAEYEMQSKSTDLERDVKLPYIRKNHVLFSPGVHNNVEYSAEVIKEAFHSTEWNKRTRSIYLDHKDEYTYDPITGHKTKWIGANAYDWCGEVDNLRLTDNGEILGDVIIVNKDAAMKIEYGAVWGVSPRGTGDPDRTGKKVVTLKFDNWSVVVNPACKTTFFNMEILECSAENIKLNQREESKMDNEQKENKEAPVDKKDPEADKMDKLTKMMEALSSEVGELKKKVCDYPPEKTDSLKKKEETENKMADKKEEEAPKDEEMLKKKKEEEELAKKKAEEEELAKKKKDEAYPEEELTEIMNNMTVNELSSWKELVKKYGVKEATKKFKGEKQAVKEKEMTEKIEKLQTEVKTLMEKQTPKENTDPAIQSAKMASSGGTERFIEVSNADENMLKYMSKGVI